MTTYSTLDMRILQNVNGWTQWLYRPKLAPTEPLSFTADRLLNAGDMVVYSCIDGGTITFVKEAAQ